MKNIVKVPIVTLLACVLGGCASAGIGTIKTLDDQALAVRIAVGATTKAQLKAAFGSAAVINFDSGYEVWVYKDQEGAPKLLRFVPVIGLAAGLVPGLAPTRTRELVVLFGPDGVVKKYRLHRT